MPTITRRHPAAIALLLMLGLLITGTAYAAVAPKDASATVTTTASAENGKKLFTANCATCHGTNGLGIEGAGPSLAGVGAAFGFRDGFRYLIGLFIGTNIVCLGVITGLAAVVLAEPALRTVFYVISVGYLLWLAFRIAFAGSKVAFIERTEPPGVLQK